MFKVLLVSTDKETFNEFESALKEFEDIQPVRTDSGAKALQIVAQSGLDLVVADEDLGDMTGLEFAGKLVSVNPMVNCALLSTLSPEVFHEKSEGLGVLAQLPVIPGQEEARELVQKLRELENIMGGS